jgi:predicted dienelactone hydrolase
LLGDGAIGEEQHRIYLEHGCFEEDLDEQRLMARNRFPVAILSEGTGSRPR